VSTWTTQAKEQMYTSLNLWIRMFFAAKSRR